MPSSVDKSPRREDRIEAADEIRLGAFRYFPDQSLLLKDGKRVRIGSRALSLLKLLAANLGHFVTNDKLIAAAWPNTRVEETNLRVQMTALRRSLNDDSGVLTITNAPGRGYALTVAASGLASRDRTAAVPFDEQTTVEGLPTQLTSLVGREDAVATVVNRLSTQRFVSVVGPGGIGKTRVVIEACTRLVEEGNPRICFVDLAPLSSGEFVASAVATTLQVGDEAKIAPMEKIVQALRQNPSLLVLDNCEHVLDAAAELAEGLLRAVPHLRILATSREPLLVDGEVTVRLAGLSGPEDDKGLTLRDALAFPAVQLFAERAAAGVDKLAFSDADAPALAEICRRLDGIPLAIELAAASVASLGVQGVAALVRDKFVALSAGRRTAPPRQRTMRATLEWSYDKLSRDEQMLLVRLSVFRSIFSLAGAQAVNPLPPEITIQLLSSLVAKSLVVVDQQRAVTRFRLLEITRTFAEEKLQASEDSAEIRRRHAAYLVALFAASRAGSKPIRRWIAARNSVRGSMTSVRRSLGACRRRATASWASAS
jgi:predicted ATPase/DNA-binding winged helix-turn-helix (wHTH) protein